ncbi:40S ribosomal protein S2 [Myotis brandtii]|uniref:40S ribosomal protein S2 n=1 Tax=Myotis brandtii TaxID=109478 RepID=S7PQ73_MYOBR|nr:40S ribosomal protein S2 [Myotis brandtii]
MKIKSLEEIYLFSLPIEESEIIDFFMGASLKAEVLKSMPVQKQTDAGQKTGSRGCTATLGNFARATFDATSKTYGYLTPDLWKETAFTKCPHQEFTGYHIKTRTIVSVQRT